MGKTHTPGPWKWWDQSSKRPIRYDLAKLLGGGKAIFTLYGGAGEKSLGKTPEDVANARLICAAPDLFQACKLQQKLIEDMSRFVGVMALKNYALFNEAPIKASAAISKAEGK